MRTEVGDVIIGRGGPWRSYSVKPDTSTFSWYLEMGFHRREEEEGDDDDDDSSKPAAAVEVEEEDDKPALLLLSDIAGEGRMDSSASSTLFGAYSTRFRLIFAAATSSTLSVATM